MWPCSGPEGRISWPRPGGISWADGEAAWSAPWPVFTLRRQAAVQHRPEEMERELNAIVDAGGEVVDVIVEHPVYGQLTGLLGVRSRYDVAEFVRRVEEHGARPLSALTGGIHLHTVRCPDEKTFRRVRKSLEAENFLLNM